MSLANLETLKDAYSSHGSSTTGSAFFVELIATLSDIVDARDAAVDALQAEVDALEARVEALEE